MNRPQATTARERAPTQRLEDGPSRAGLALGRYRLERRLGSGGFGVVWLAHDIRLERDVAVKVVPRERGEREQVRVEREGLAAARLNHPGIVALYELGTDERDTYLVSELVEGATLEQLTREGAVSDRDVARIGAALCDALDHAHARGVVHRDVKPANVMVLAEPAAGAGFAKLTDFGIAHLAGDDALTATGDVMGTLAYMAPEQAEGVRVTGACDVYSLALTLYEAWTGHNPVRGQSPAATARRLGRALPSLRARRRDLPPALCEAIDAALDPDPDRRPGPGELAEALRDAERELSPEGGLVEPETLERFGLTAARGRSLLGTLLRPRATDHPGSGAAVRLAPRLGAGLAIALLVFAALEGLAPAPPFSTVVVAGAAGLLTVLMPRIGWALAVLFVCGWLASPEADRPGTAMLVAAGAAASPLLMPRAGTLWSLPALAPLLGAAALAPLFVGVAALAATPWRRAGLAAAGFLWLALAEALTGSELLFGAADGTLPRGTWEGSAVDAVGDALLPLASSPAPAPVVVWVAFAVLLPVLVRGRWAPLDLVAGALWAVALVAAHGVLGDLLAATTELDRARGAVAGAALAATVAVIVTFVAGPVRDGPTDPALP